MISCADLDRIAMHCILLQQGVCSDMAIIKWYAFITQCIEMGFNEKT